MARRRYVSTDISIDSQLVKLQKAVGFFGPLLYTWMLPHAGDDCHITDDLDELQLMVIPGFKVDPEQVSDAVNAMLEIGLLLQDDAGFFFPPKSFYKHQSYIPEVKRWVPQIAEEERVSPQNAADRRELPQNAASPSLSLTPSPSPTPSLSPSLSTRESGTEEDPLTFSPNTDAAWPDDPPPKETFAGRYVREHQTRNAGNPPSPIKQAAAKQLERDFPTADCIAIAEDYGWDRHPNYYREVLSDPNRGKRTPHAGQSRRSAGSNGLSPADKARRQLAAR